MDKKKSCYILFGHGGSGNHGCEAIVRSTVQVLSSSIKEADIVLTSAKIDQEHRYGVDSLCHIENVAVGSKDLDFFKAYLTMKLTGRYEVFDTYRYRAIINKYSHSSVAISIGGDNYCYGNNTVLAYQNRLFNDAGIRTILWGCSIEPEVLDDAHDFADISCYKHVFARESLTYDAIKAHGITNVSLFPDPAFTLGKKDVTLPLTNLVGINLSPYVMKCESSQNEAFSNYITLVEHILSDTDLNIALIPHVVWAHSDDRKPLIEIYNRFCHTNRVIMVEDNNAEYLKGVISQCRFLIAARTHASIAAYSTCVPTLVVGYSIKAKGIAKDIFGTYDHYVIPVQSLQSAHDLLDGFQWLVAHEAQIKKHLQTTMPAYIGRAWQAGEKLKEIVCQ